MKLCMCNTLKSEKGSVMILALAVILTLTAFGTVSLMTSVANIQMSSKYRDWSKDYYALDKNAELRVNQINQLLEKAEKVSQAYMTGQYYLTDDPVILDDPSDPEISDQLRNTSSIVKTYMYSQWQTNDDAFKRLYYYYASYLLSFEQNPSDPLDPQKKYNIAYLDDPTADYDDYLAALFDSSNTNYSNVLSEENLAVIINSKSSTEPQIPVDPTDPIAILPATVLGKEVSVKLNIVLPSYKALPNQVTFIGNPVWANAITASGSIGFEGTGTSIINGDLFSADKDEGLYLNDNYVPASGIYSNSADIEINGNVYSKGNLHILGNNSTINIYGYSHISNAPGFSTILKDRIFSKNGLFFDYDNTIYPTPSDYTYIQWPTDPTDSTLYFVNGDVKGGNIYCNSLKVDQGVSGGVINAYGNVSTFNDIKMNGLNSEINVSGNYVGINDRAHNGDPNASSTVINNTALDGGKIKLDGKFIVPGTAFAEYQGVKKNTWPRFFWPSTIQNLIDPWENQQYYQTGESITAKDVKIYSAYMSPVTNPLPQYDYSMEQFTDDLDPELDPEPNLYVETNINSYYLMRGDTSTEDEPDDIYIPKMSQLADYLSRRPVDSKVSVGSPVEGYSFGLALLNSSVYGPPIAELDPDLQPQSTINYSDYKSYYSKFSESLGKIFISKVQNLGTIDKVATSFDEVFVNYDVLSSKISSTPSEKPTFVYLKATVDNPAVLELSNATGIKGIVYCDGDLNITGDQSFNGTIICEGNLIVSGNPTITYDEAVIKSVLSADVNARLFFAPGAMGEDTSIPTTDYKGAAYRSDGIHFKIVEWKEQQQA